MANMNKKPSLLRSFYNYYYLTLFLIILLSYDTNALSQDSLCGDSSFCSKVLPSGDFSDIRSTGRVSLRKSLSLSRNFHDYVVKYLERRSGALPEHAVRALEDCRVLAALNIEILSGCLDIVGGLNALLSGSAGDDLHTAMSTTVTNLDTCYDGLAVHPELKDEISRVGGLSEDARLSKLSLSLCLKGWVPKVARHAWNSRPHHPFIGENGELKLRFRSEEKRKAYEAAVSGHRGPGRRRVLQVAGEEAVYVYDMVFVNKDGTYDYTNISAAVAAAPKNLSPSTGYFMIYIMEGVYDEIVDVPTSKKYVFMLGAGINRTIITGNRSVGDNFTTFNSATLVASGLGFLAVDLTVRNTAGPAKGQAVALRSGADQSTFYRCSFEAYQDTLYTHSNRQFYKNCDISGTVDFIFGNAAVVLQNCNITPRLPLKGQFNAVTAQGRTDPNQNTGTTIQNCTIKASPDLAASNGTTKTYLGRPWKDYSRTVVMQSFLDSLVQPAGWREWSTNVSQLSTLYYAEFGNSGPGSNTSARVTWPGFHLINATEAEGFTVSPFIGGDGWIPQTGVPYKGGL